MDAIVISGVVLLVLTGSAAQLGVHVVPVQSPRAPSFLLQPPTRMEFSNSSGGRLDCSASGTPPPVVSWVSNDGSAVSDLVAVRRLLPNGTLLLLPFPAAAYRQDVHAATYRCLASNNVGTITSREVHVRAVVTQVYSVHALTEEAPRGCTAVLRCSAPSFVRDLVRVVSWLQEPNYPIYPSLQGDVKHHMLPSGELLVHHTEYSDQIPRYWCRTTHRLTKTEVTSSPITLRIVENRALIPPTIVVQTTNVIVSQDEGAVLLCIAAGCPTPTYTWHQPGGIPGDTALSDTGFPRTRTRLLGPVLAIEAATVDDSGTYRCLAANAAGEASADLRLSVSAPLRVEVLPSLLVVPHGGRAEFRCRVSESAVLLTWYKDGTPLAGGRGGVIGTSDGNGDGTLQLSGVGPSDRGVYQCMARRADDETAQSSAELRLADAAPVMQYTFIEQTLQPGPAVSLKCSATGQPPPTIKWTLDGFPLSANQRYVIGEFVTVHGDVISHVNISHVMVQDGGEYTCVATNRVGSTQHSARLNVYGRAYIRTMPRVSAVAGQTLQIKCPVAGYPIEEIKWQRGEVDLPVDIRQKVLPGGVLRIERVQKSQDSGKYTCLARSKHEGFTQRQVDVSVTVPPKLSPLPPRRTLHLGERASITCSAVAGDGPLNLSWLKDGRPLDAAARGKAASVALTSVDAFNSILLIESVSPEHGGNYTCQARNAAASVALSQELAVNVPPIIEPFAFQDGLSEGMRTRTVCGVSSGDPPISIRWLKDGSPLYPQSGVNISSLDHYSSLLSIPHLTAALSGDFTCVASNAAAEVRYTANLQVKVPPTWEIEPTDVAVERGRSAMLNCRAKGVPIPTTVWKKAAGGRGGEYEEILSKPQMRVLNNGSLHIMSVTETAEGFYLCQANNSIGSPLGKMVELRVNSAPYFAGPQSRVVSVRRGESAVLRCDVRGDRPITVVWLRGSSELTPATNYRVSVKQEPRAEGVSAELQVTAAESGDSGSYYCEASNLFGRDRQLLQLQVQEPPPSPTGLRVAHLTSRSATIQWSSPQSPTTLTFGQTVSEVTHFIVEYRQVGDIAGSWQILEVSGQSASLLSDLRPATRYVVRVSAEGPAGRSPPSREMNFRTEPQQPGGPPQDITVRGVSATSLLVTWSPPDAELRNGDITAYSVGFRLSRTSSSYNMTKVTADSVATDSDSGEEPCQLVLMGLQPYSAYEVVVQAINSVGNGPQSEPVTALTLEDVPGAPPEEVRCAPLSSESLQIFWKPPPSSKIHGTLDGYRLHYEALPSLAQFDSHIDTDASTEWSSTAGQQAVLQKLHKAMNYSITVRAFTRKGDGVPSAPVFCQTDEDVPGPPADIKVVQTSSEAFLVTWRPPAEVNGQLTRYTLYKRVMDKQDEVTHGKEVVMASQTSFEAKRLMKNVQYQFWVTAHTRVGEGQSSPVVAQTLDDKVPARVASIAHMIRRPRLSSVTLACRAVGQPSPRINWNGPMADSVSGSMSAIGLLRRGRVLDSGELLISDLQREDSGNYTCSVANAYGADAITYSLIVQVPPSSPLLFVGSATSSTVLLHWKTGDTGGARITGFILTYRRSHMDSSRVQIPRYDTSHELKGLQCGSTYHVHLVAMNHVGSSLPSASLSVRTQGQAPGLAPIASLLVPNATSVLLRLSSWPDNGCPLLYFVVRYRLLQSRDWILVSNSLKPQRRFLISGLTPATGYQLHIEAHNIAGSSSAEYTVFTLTKDGERPPQDVLLRGGLSQPFYKDLRVVLPLSGALVAVLVAVTATALCWRTKQVRAGKELMENQQNAEAQRERCYATIHKMTMSSGSEKIPETAEDISPYATFQLSGASVVPGAANTLLHSFMYHERAMTEGCASPPPPPHLVGSSARSRRRSSRKTDADTDESDSDETATPSVSAVPPLDSARTKHNFIYHGAQSSTSSDMSPMSEQKSLGRRGRHRWLGPTKVFRGPHALQPIDTYHRNQTTTPRRRRALSDAAAPDRPTSSEAECEMDSMTKLKLGLRSSFWRTTGSGGGGGGTPGTAPSTTDYSIAV